MGRKDNELGRVREDPYEVSSNQPSNPVLPKSYVDSFLVDRKPGLAFFKKDQELPGELKEKRNIAAVDLLAGDYDKAIEAYEEIIKEVAKNGQVWLEYTHSLLGAGRKEDGRKAYQSAKKFTRKEESVFGIGNSHTMVEYGILMEEEGESETAEQIYDAVSKQTPDWYKPWFLLASIHKKKENYERAEEIYREV